ncbi:hypothetical protein DFH11DRAFT_1469634, partial [Phellopilus nigrolimitatus]
KLQTWLPHREVFLDELLRHDGRIASVDLDTCHSCKTGDASIRCIDCYGRGLVCRDCAIKNHSHQPLHRIQVWTGEFFRKTSLQVLGLRMQLGHDGGLCHNRAAANKNFIVMDISGFHLANIDFCACSGASPLHIQLLRAGLFPASIDRPRTVFTFDVLKTFHELTLQGKTNTYDFYRAMARKTDNTRSPAMYKYTEFTFVVRLWRHLVMLKRAGRAQDPHGAGGTREGELAVECPACPHPGKNLPPNWETVSELERWLYTQFIAVDANFKLKSKDRGLRDIELAPGWVYFVNEEQYQAGIRLLPDEEDEPNTCQSQHNAILAANSRNGLNYKTRGAGAAICGRHSFMLKNAVGDLAMGERYNNMDWVVLSALRWTPTRDLLISYDIGCQWSKNLAKRVPRYPEWLRLDMSSTRLRAVVPKFHLPAHGAKCQTEYSLNFLPYVGRTYGEGVESEWAHINGTASSTQEMAPAVRHETLNDHWGSWNWQKLVAFSEYFVRKLHDALHWREEHREHFKNLSQTIPQHTRDEWERMVERWNADRSQPDPYAEPVIEMTLNDVRLEFANEDAEEAERGNAPVHAVTERSFLYAGIDIEERQSFRKQSMKQYQRTSAAAATKQQGRNTLYRQITQWRLVQDVYMPGVSAIRSQAALSADATLKGTTAEEMQLFLPSSVPHLANPSLKSMEARLRIAQADDALATIRRLRRILAGVKIFKKLNVVGTGNRPNTRMYSLYQRFQQKVDLAVERYRAAYDALKSLDPNGDWTDRFKKLEKGDVRGPDRDEEMVRKVGEGYHKPSWIWEVPRANTNADGSLIEFGDSVRVEWAKSRARFERWKEEIALLCEEMRRVLAYLKWRADYWLSLRGLRTELDLSTQSGVDAYAAKQASLFSSLAAKFAANWIPELRELRPAPTWATEYPLQP